LFNYKKKEKESRYPLGFRFALTTRYEKRGKQVFDRSFAAGVRKPTRVKKKNEKEKESNRGFYRSDVVCNLVIE
jgi:hypothetical protein